MKETFVEYLYLSTMLPTSTFLICGVVQPVELYVVSLFLLRRFSKFKSGRGKWTLYNLIPFIPFVPSADCCQLCFECLRLSARRICNANLSTWNFEKLTSMVEGISFWQTLHLPAWEWMNEYGMGREKCGVSGSVLAMKTWGQELLWICRLSKNCISWATEWQSSFHKDLVSST